MSGADDHLSAGSPLMDLHKRPRHVPGTMKLEIFSTSEYSALWNVSQDIEIKRYNDIMYKQMDTGALSLNKSRLPGQRSVTFCPEHEYFILSL